MRPGRAESATGADLLDQVHDAIVVMDLSAKIVKWNRSAERLYGYSSNEVVGRKITFLYDQPDVRRLNTALSAVLKKTGSGELELRARPKDGKAVHVHLRLSLVRSKNGSITGFAGCSNDISAQTDAHEKLKRARNDLELEIRQRTAALKAACAELRASEHNRRIVLAHSPGVVYACSAHPPFATTFVSDNVERLFGYTPAHFLTSGDLWINHIHPDDRETTQTFGGAAMRSGEGVVQYRFSRVDGEYRWVRDSIARMDDESGHAIGFAGYVEDITESVTREEDKRKAERLKIAAETLITTQEAERNRIARELHDDLTQRVSAFALEFAALERTAADNRKLRLRLRALRRQFTGFSDDLQAVAYELHSVVLHSHGLRAALNQECALRQKRTGLAVTLDFDPACQKLAAGVAICIYRVVQEALRNITEHSGAPSATIVVRKENNAVLLAIEDSGRGFDPAAERPTRGLGIISMAERVHLLNGAFSIESAPGAGTRIRVLLPLDGGANDKSTSSTRR